MKNKIKVCHNCDGFGKVWMSDPDDYDDDPDVIEITCPTCDGEGEVLYEGQYIIRPH